MKAKAAATDQDRDQNRDRQQAKGNIKIVPFVVELEHCTAGRRQDRQSVRRSQRLGVAYVEVSHLRDRQRDNCEENSSQLAPATNETQQSPQGGQTGSKWCR